MLRCYLPSIMSWSTYREPLETLFDLAVCPTSAHIANERPRDDSARLGALWFRQYEQIMHPSFQRPFETNRRNVISISPTKYTQCKPKGTKRPLPPRNVYCDDVEMIFNWPTRTQMRARWTISKQQICHDPFKFAPSRAHTTIPYEKGSPLREISIVLWFLRIIIES